MYTGIETPMYCTGLNIGRIGHVPAILANFEQYRPVQEKAFFFFFKKSFVIFEFLLGKSGNLFALTY